MFLPSDFDPARAERDFVIAANDVSELLILPPVITAIANLSPASRVVIRSVEPSMIDHAVDLAIIGAPLPEGPYASRDLFEDHFVILARPIIRTWVTILPRKALPGSIRP